MKNLAKDNKAIFDLKTEVFLIKNIEIKPEMY